MLLPAAARELTQAYRGGPLQNRPGGRPTVPAEGMPDAAVSRGATPVPSAEAMVSGRPQAHLEGRAPASSDGVLQREPGIEDLVAMAHRIGTAVESVIDGKAEAIRLALTVLLAEGNLLIEDVPGVGKTMLAKA